MSSFSNGTLTKAEYLDVVKSCMSEDSYVVEEANGWICYMRRQPYGLDAKISIYEAMPEVIRMSRQAPMLFLDHQEDHGWRFDVMHAGKVRSALNVNYEEARMSREEIEEIHNDPLMQEIGYQPSFFDPVQRLQGVNLDAFSLFGLEDSGLEALRELFVPENFQRENIYAMPRALKRALGIEMEFMSWEKVKYYGDAAFSILAQR